MKISVFVTTVMILVAYAPDPLSAQARPDDIPVESMGAIIRMAMRESNHARLALEALQVLGLSDAQARSLELEASRGDSVLSASIQTMQSALRELPGMDRTDTTLDEGKVREAYQRRAQAEADFYMASFRARQAIARILTPVQQRQLEDWLMSERMKAMHSGLLGPPPPPSARSAPPQP